MPRIRFTANLARHIDTTELTAAGGDVRSVFADAFARHPQARGYVLDDQGGLRKHVSVFIDGVQVRDRATLRDPVPAGAVIDIIQALSGG